jgi:hypothetical protein
MMWREDERRGNMARVYFYMVATSKARSDEAKGKEKKRELLQNIIFLTKIPLWLLGQLQHSLVFTLYSLVLEKE